MLGKKKCRMLREIRQKIATENDIPFVTEDCKYKGDCKGTCPKCESELRYLEEQLEKRRALGRKVTVSAVALGLVTSAAGCTNNTAGYVVEGDVPYVETTELEGLIDPGDTTEPAEVLDGEVAITDEPESELEGDVACEPDTGVSETEADG